MFLFRLPPLVIAVCLTGIAPLSAAPDSVVTFHEIHYHPSDALAPEWIELHNQMSIRVDVGGWALRGGVDYVIPEGTYVAPGGYLVVSSATGSPLGSLGPFSGKLDNAGESLRLENRWGRLMDEVQYGDSGDWDAAADGAGPSLAKMSPNAASSPAENWQASSDPGGTPGAANFPDSQELPPRILFESNASWKYRGAVDGGSLEWTSLAFSDVSWASGSARFAETGGAGVSTVLPTGAATYQFRRPFAHAGDFSPVGLLFNGQVTGEVRVFLNGSEVWHRESQDGPLNFIIPSPALATGANLLAVELRPHASTGARLAFDVRASLLPASTAAVSPRFLSALRGTVVINEIHYHQRPTYADPLASVPYAESDLEWLELHNSGATAVSLAGWKLKGSVDYNFSNIEQIPAGGYLVLTPVEYSGKLPNDHGQLRLEDSADATVDEAEYFDDGRWTDLADGNGHSLERRHPQADGKCPESWAASLEWPKVGWQTITYRATGAEPPGTNYPDTWHEFLLGFLDGGEALIDDVSVIEDPDSTRLQLIQNGSFSGDVLGSIPAKWRCLGTHRLSRVEADPDNPGNRVLRLVATAELEHTYNNASTTLVGNRVVNAAKTYEISFRARWVAGSPQLNSRLYLNRAARTTILAQPVAAGSPNAANVSALPIAPPELDGLQHYPIVPMASQPVRVMVWVGDASEVTEVALHFRANDGAWQTVGMGTPTGGSPSRYEAVMPGQADKSIVQIYVSAVNAHGVASLFPPAGLASGALFRVGDGGISTQPVKNKMRLVMSAAEADDLHNPIHSVSNFRHPATVIYNDREVYYDVGVRLRAAPYGRQGPRAGWNISFHAEQLFRGVQPSAVIDGAFNMPKTDGTGWLENSIAPSVNELLFMAVANRAGQIPSSYDDIVYFQTPRTSEGNRRAQLKMARFNNNYLEEAFADGADGLLYKQELIYYPSSTVDGNPESLKNPYNQVRDLDVKYLGASKDNYRFTYLVQNNADKDDFSRIIALGQSFDSTAANLYANTSAVIDADNWMRVLALNGLIGLADTYNQGLAHNMQFYVRPTDAKVLLMPWDQDHAFYHASNANIFGQGTHRVRDVITLPQNRRIYCGHLLDLCQSAFTNSYLDDWVSHLSEVAGKTAYVGTFKSWITARRNYVLNQLNTLHPAIPFNITTNSGNDFAQGSSFVTLTGNGWIDVHEIRLGDGSAVPVTWLNGSQWQVQLPLAVGVNVLTLRAFNLQGQEVGADAISITNSGTVDSASAANLVLSEIHYHPDVTEEEEFLELMNIGPRSVDLTGVRFVAGVDFTFTGSAIIQLAAGGRVLVVRNAAAFQSRYGTGGPVAGTFTVDKSLANEGDRLTLLDRGGQVIRDFTYDDHWPWPPEADGAGPSLTLINPLDNPDHALAENWRPSREFGGSPGGGDALTYTSGSEVDYVLAGGPAWTLADGSVSWIERLGADDFQLVPELSQDLTNWSSDPGDGSIFVYLEPTSAPSFRTMRLQPSSMNHRSFFRLRLIPR